MIRSLIKFREYCIKISHTILKVGYTLWLKCKGINLDDVYNLDISVCKYLIPRLIIIQKQCNNPGLKESIDKMIDGFSHCLRMYANDKDDEKGIMELNNALEEFKKNFRKLAISKDELWTK